jgi:hypothetical protein
MSYCTYPTLNSARIHKNDHLSPSQNKNANSQMSEKRKYTSWTPERIKRLKDLARESERRLGYFDWKNIGAELGISGAACRKAYFRFRKIERLEAEKNPWGLRWEI